MTKEMGVILLGLLNVAIATNLLAVPSAWRMLVLVASGIALIVIGFLLRAQGMTRPERSSPHHPFVESDATILVHNPPHEHKEGITSLN